MQFAVPAFHAVVTGEGDVLSLRRPKNFVSPLSHGAYQFFPTAGSFHLRVDRGDQLKFPTLVFLRGSELTGGELGSLGLKQDRQSVGLTNLIAQRSELLECVRVLSELVSVLEVHRVDDEVGVGIVRIAVGADKSLVARPGAGGERQRDLVGLDGGDLIP